MSVPNLRFVPSAPFRGNDELGEEYCLQPEAGRYRLVAYVGCPWCRRAVLARRLLGLQDAIALSMSWKIGDDGFEFTDEHEHAPFDGKGRGFDPALRIHTHRELYRRQPSWQEGESTSVPVLVDEHAEGVRGQIVMRESGDIVADFATAWMDFQAEGAPQLFPDLADDDAWNQVESFMSWLNEDLAPYFGRMVHAESDEERSLAQKRIVEALTNLNNYLQGRELTADAQIRATDVNLFATLVSLASFHGKIAYRMGAELAKEQGADEAGMEIAGWDTVRRSVPPFADWPEVDRFYQKFADNPLWLTAAEKRALKLV